eukprot:TRINITY_DN50147_c0_g1_i1.p1 TRINITY_DN50147_c0_g1~~TRINITY_DN50147_c0_g1_i1.p1  ORF type:complete len:304 (+),score=63.07 TRINITY_DN50147_c0_g1_i1:60-971(+)
MADDGPPPDAEEEPPLESEAARCKKEFLCGVCLEGLFSSPQKVVNLSCAHRHHDMCLFKMERFFRKGWCPCCHEIMYSRISQPEADRLFTQAALCEGRQQYVMYDENRGVEKLPSNEKKAFDLYELAVRCGNVRALACLGWMYESGRGTVEHFDKALALYIEGDEKCDARAATRLGTLYAQGRGVKKDLDKAVALYEKAHEMRDAKATCLLGTMYEIGNGVETNRAKAVEFYEEAHKAGYHGATARLGLLYEHGIGVKMNIDKAVDLYERGFSVNKEQRATRGGAWRLVRSLPGNTNYYSYAS